MTHKPADDFPLSAHDYVAMKRRDDDAMIQEIDRWCGTSRKRFQFVKRLHEFFRAEEICLILRAADKSKLI